MSKVEARKHLNKALSSLEDTRYSLDRKSDPLERDMVENISEVEDTVEEIMDSLKPKDQQDMRSFQA